MMAKLMDLLERFVVAVEKIAEAGCCASSSTIPVRIQGRTVNMPMGPGVVASEKEALQAGCSVAQTESGPAPQNDQAAVDAGKLKREMIKKELREKGIPFNASAKTETLEKLLAAIPAARPCSTTSADPISSTESAGQSVATSAATMPTNGGQVSYTKEQVRDALVKVSAAKGKDEALGILKTLGKAETLSKVDASRYQVIIDACKVRGVSVNA
jgi:hypothetical protein